MSKKILVPLDGTRFAEAALPLAMSLAKRDGAALELAMVWEPLPDIVDTGEWIRQVKQWEENKRAEDRRYVSEVARRVEEGLGRTVSIKYLMGHPEEELTKWAAKSRADVVVMATHGHGPVSRPWLGSVADRMVRKGTVPVMLVRPTEPIQEVVLTPGNPFRKILVTLDGSELAEKALRKSLLVGDDPEHTEITLLTVLTFPIPMATPEGGVALDSPALLEAQKDVARAHLERIAAHVAAWGCKVKTLTLATGVPSEMIVNYAASAGFDLIAMATHGRGGAARMLLGSVADKVLRSSTVPTLLFHPGPARGGGQTKLVAAAAVSDWP
jgi:nucleotide-binding universal stress UspA family protein